MASDFSRTLALLRREKRISQRTAAGDLQVSLANLPTAYPERAESLLQVLQNVSDSIEEFDGTTKKKK